MWELRNSLSSETLIIGNGDIKSLKEARALAKKTGLDGIMIGRGVLEDPWFFSENNPVVNERLSAIMDHVKVFERLNKSRNFNNVKKYFKGYITGFLGAKNLRDNLMRAKSIIEVESIINDFKNKYKKI